MPPDTDTITRIYAGDILKFDETPDGLMVHGKATSTTLDLDQQRCNAKWLKAAMPDWFEVAANVREQHSNVAAGVGRELAEGAKPGDWSLKSLVVDTNSQNKVRTGVLKGYSIGIKGTQIIKTKDAPKGEIVGGKIVEISLVDRPCNPDCMLTVVKSAEGSGAWEPVPAGEIVWSVDADGNETTKAVTLDTPTDVDEKALNGQTDPLTQQARNAADVCSNCGGDGTFPYPADSQVCKLCGGTGKVADNPTEDTDGSPGPETGTPSAQAAPKSAEPEPLPDADVTVEALTTQDGSQTAYKAVHGPTGIEVVGFSEEAAKATLAADVAKAAAPPAEPEAPDAALADVLAQVAAVRAEEEKAAGGVASPAPFAGGPEGAEAFIPAGGIGKGPLPDAGQTTDSPTGDTDGGDGVVDESKTATHDPDANAQVTEVDDTEKHATPKVACPTCKGKGKIKAGKVDCPTCHGDKVVSQAVADKTSGDKKTAKADAEKAPIPELPAENPLARAFLRTAAANGMMATDALEAMGEVTKALEAEVAKGDTCPICDGDGVIKVKDQCASCKGTGMDSSGDDDPACDGKGIIKTQETCSACDGSGNTSKAPEPDPVEAFAVQVAELDPSAEAYLTIVAALKETAKALAADDEKAELPAAVIAFDPSENPTDALVDLAKKQFSDAERAALAKKGQALPIKDPKTGEVTSGAYPIDDVASLKDAITSIGRAKDPGATKALIKKMATKLGREDLIPDEWKSEDPDDTKAADPGAWVHDPAMLTSTRDNIVALMKAELDELCAGENEISDLYNLLAVLCGFLDFWCNEAAGGEDPSPFQVNDDTEDAVIWTSMGIEPDTIKAASDEEADEETRKAAQKRLRKQVRKALGLNKTEEFDDSQKAVIADTAKEVAQEAFASIQERLETVEKMAAPGGPVRSRTRQEDTKATRKDELEVEINALEKTLNAVTDPDLATGYRARLVSLRTEKAALA